jgi:hypothetical protein
MRKIRERPEQQMLIRTSRDSGDRSEIDQRSATILRISPPLHFSSGAGAFLFISTSAAIPVIATTDDRLPQCAAQASWIDLDVMKNPVKERQ